jgi:diguanylate cyclase (GGDEF)-like protein
MRISYVWGIVVVSAILAVAKPIGAVPFFYLWPVLFAAYFFSRADLWAALVVMTTTYGAALAFWGDPGIRAMLFMGAVIPVALVAILVHLLKERLNVTVAELRHAAATDPLTGLPNRRAFDQALELEVARSRRSGSSVAVAVVDIDHFKTINDRLGHAGGDRALCRVAEVLGSEVRPGDVAARVGGDEFALLLVDVDRAAALACAQRIAARVSGQTGEDESVRSLSVGVAVAGADCAGPDELLLAADGALYRAKDSGRGRVAFEDGELMVAALTAPTPA